VEGPGVVGLGSKERDIKADKTGGLVERQAFFGQPVGLLGIRVADTEGEVVGVAATHRSVIPELVLPTFRELVAADLPVRIKGDGRFGIAHHHSDVGHVIE